MKTKIEIIEQKARLECSKSAHQKILDLITASYTLKGISSHCQSILDAIKLQEKILSNEPKVVSNDEQKGKKCDCEVRIPTEDGNERCVDCNRLWIVR